MITRLQPLVDGTVIIGAQSRILKPLRESCARRFINEGNGKATNDHPQQNVAGYSSKLFSFLHVIVEKVRGFVWMKIPFRCVETL